jgi:hypothetical protein
LARDNRKPKADPRVSHEQVPRVPKAMAVSEGGQHEHPVFSFALMDRGYAGEWGWHLLGEADGKKLLDQICDLARSTWIEIRAQRVEGRLRNHSQKVSTLCRDAQQRLTVLHYDDISDEMFRFRLQNTWRLWGFELGNGVFYAVWWDPTHKVCPPQA